MLRAIARAFSGWRGSREVPAKPPVRPFPKDAFVAFVVPADAATRVNLGDHYSTNIAAMRLRAIIPARQLARQVSAWFVPLEVFLRDPALSSLGQPGAIVISMLVARSILKRREAFFELLAEAAVTPNRVPLFADVPETFSEAAKRFGEPRLGSLKTELGKFCTFIVPCRSLGEGLARDARRGVVVIEDPYENRPQPVRVAPGSPLRLLWFGNLGDINANLVHAALAEALAAVAGQPVRIDVVADTSASHHFDAMRARLVEAHPRCELRLIQWSLPATEEALARCDFVLIPHAFREDWSKGKSHNRLVAAIRAGRFAIASPIPTYLELADYAWVGENLGEGLSWALARPQEAAARVQAGQGPVEQRFSPESVGRKWAAALGIEG